MQKPLSEKQILGIHKRLALIEIVMTIPMLKVRLLFIPPFLNNSDIFERKIVGQTMVLNKIQPTLPVGNNMLIKSMAVSHIYVLGA